MSRSVRGWAARRRRAAVLAFVLCLAGSLAWPNFSAGGSQPTSGDIEAALRQESAFADFEADVVSRGALGIYVDAQSQVVVVIPRGFAAPFGPEDVSRLGVPVRVEERDATRTDISDAKERIATIFKEPAEGEMPAWFFDPQVGKVLLYSARSDASLQASLGDVWRIIDHRPYEVVEASRQSDSPPFWGGARAVEDGLEPLFDCTTGFAVSISGVRHMVSAGHCWPYVGGGAVVVSPGNGLQIGVASQCPSGKDMLLLSGQTYAGKIYVGGYAGTGKSVNAAANPSVGQNYWYSGGATYENASQRVVAMDGAYTGNCGALNNLIVFTEASEAVCPVFQGDSGAPFYYKLNSYLSIRGMVISYTKDLRYCFAHRWSQIQNTFGATIVTS